MLTIAVAVAAAAAASPGGMRGLLDQPETEMIDNRGGHRANCGRPKLPEGAKLVQGKQPMLDAETAAWYNALPQSEIRAIFASARLTHALVQRFKTPKER